MESNVCQPKVSRPLHLPSCSIRHGWLYSMDCQSRVRPGFTSVITIVWIYTTSALFQTSRLVAGRRAFGCWALLYGASTTFINDAGDTASSLAKTDREREEKGPWTEQPHGLASNNVPPPPPPPARPTLPACLQTQSNSPSTSSCPSPTAARLKLSRSQSSKGGGRWGGKGRR